MSVFKKILQTGVFVFVFLCAAMAVAQQNTRISLGAGGVQGNNDSRDCAISGDGTFVLFESNATNLVAGDTNAANDLFVYDAAMDSLSRVNIASDGTEANGDVSSDSRISNTGRYSIFTSSATNHVPGDTNGNVDCFVHDRMTGKTVRVSAAASAEGDGNCQSDPDISDDGRYAVFESGSTNLVMGDTNAVNDCFIYDMQMGTTERISVATDGTEGNGSCSVVQISGDGNFAIFVSSSSNLVPGDTNGASDLFLRDLQNDTTTRISIATDGTEGDSSVSSTQPSISSDGRYVAFVSNATNMTAETDTNTSTDVFIRDTQMNTTVLASVSAAGGSTADSGALGGQISDDGNYIILRSSSTDLSSTHTDTNGDQDIYLRNMDTGDVKILSLGFDGAESDGASFDPDLSRDAQYYTFYSLATNIVSGDTNGFRDVFYGVNDMCPADDAKINAGQCGCGIADTDTDGDSTADCNDSCPSDANKTTVGICGCGVADTDANGNSFADCLDVTTDTTPSAPVLEKAGGRKIKVTMQQYADNVTYKILLKGPRDANGRRRKKRATSKNGENEKTVRVPAKGKWRVNYRVVQDGTKSKRSPRANIKL